MHRSISKFAVPVISLAACLFALWMYHPCYLYFQNDDLIHIPLSKAGVILQHNSFRPVCDLVMILDYNFWLKEAWGYHLTNLVLHMAATLLVYVLSNAFIKKYSPNENASKTATMVSALFFIYACHSEAVFWILGRSAIIGTLFFLPACIFYLKRERIIFYLLAVVFAVLAWLSYESTLFLPVVFATISIADYKKGNATLKKEMVYAGIPFILAAIYLVSRYFFMQELIGDYESGVLKSDWSLLPLNYAKLVLRSIIPPTENAYVLIFCFLVFALALTYFIYKQDKSVKRILLIIVGFWLLSLTLYATLGIDTRGSESERFIYLPSFFICLLISILLMKIKSFSIRLIVFSVIIASQLVFLFTSMQHYRFAGDVVKKTFSEINSYSNKKLLQVNHVPEESRGALILRRGLEEGFYWLKNDNTIDSIQIKSNMLKEMPMQPNYKVNKINTGKFLHTEGKGNYRI